MRKSDRALINNLLLLVALFWPVALQIDAAETATVGGGGLPARAAGAKARLLFPEQVLAGFTNGVDRVRVIVNLVPSARALQPTDWHAAQSRRSLHAANRGASDEVRKTLGTNDHQLRFQFDNQPGFSCEVTTKALEALLNNPQVESVEPVHELQAHLAQGIPLINALASRSTYNGAGIAIAICDTGIDYNHPRLGGGGFPNSKVIGGYDFGDSDTDPIPNTQAHGTCCAGIAAGDLGTVGDYIGGVAPGAKLYACKISYGTTGSALNDAMVAAWDWCVTHQYDDSANPIMVISTSFGGNRNYSTCDSYVTAMTTAANNAVAAGITVLASSGNDGYCDSIAWPACISSVISVGAVYDASFGTYLPCVNSASCAPKTANSGCATGYYATDNTQADRVTSYANVASFLDILAPGNSCYTLDISGASGYSTGDYYDSFGGTSAACPYAAGAVACLQHAAKTLTGSYLTPADVRARLASSGDLITDTKVAITKPRVNLGHTIATLVPVPRIVLDSSALTAEGCPPANGVIDPGETVAVSFVLKNTGASNTANVVATLLSTNGVTFPSAPQSYGALLAGGAAVARVFTFTAAGACGGVLTTVLQLQDGANNLGTVTNTFTLGALGSAGTANYSSGGVSVAIPASTTVEVPIAIANDGLVTDVNVRVRLNYTRDSSLVISLVHPDGTVITLANKRGGTGANYGSGASSCSGTFTVFDDAASTAITSGTAPFAGTYQPEQLLSALNGKAVPGTWKLRVANSSASRTGTIYCFQLDIARQAYACCTGTGADLGLVVTNTPNPVTVSSNLTYNLTVTNLGFATAVSVTVTDTLPASVTFLSASVSQGTWATNGGGLFTCALGDIGVNGSATISLVVEPNGAGSLSNTVTVSSSVSDPNLANNTATAVTAVNVAPPVIDQPPQPQNVCPGATATFTVAAAGAGPLSYQWQTNSINLTNGGHYGGVATSNLTVAGADASVLRNYRCVVSNAGGSATSSAAALTINDTTPPTILCPPDVTVVANSGCSATNVALGSAAIGDNCGVVGVTNNGPGSYPLGTNVVIWTVADTSGNTNTCQQRVIVLDGQAPAISWHMTNLVVAAGTNCQASMPDITGTNYILAVDSCSSVMVTQSVAAGTALGLGTNQVVLGVFDAAGNVAYGTNYVVVADETPPTIACPADLTVTNDAGQCGAVVHYTAPVGQDNCSTPVTIQVAGLVSGSLFPVGKTTNLFKVTDGAGNSAECGFVVTVADTEPPRITWHATNMVVAAGTNCQAAMPDITGTNYILAVDSCSSVTVTQSVAAGTVLGLGTNEVVLGVFDAAGNVCYGTNYVVVADVTPPTITCPTNMIVRADAGQCSVSNVTWEVTASDNCGVTKLVSVPASGATFPGGVTTVVCTATDASGNTNSCSFTVTVIDSLVIVSGPVGQTVLVGQAATFNVTATNGCGNDLAYQWRFQGLDIPGATANYYALGAVQLTNTGSYEVVVTNLAAAATSPVAVLTVTGPYLVVYPAESSQPGSGRTNFSFAYPTVAGVSYVVQYKDALLETGSWLPLLTNPGTGGLITNDFPITADPPGRFYRILIP